MSPEVKEWVRRGKTCAPFKCEEEVICYKLAKEVERLYAERGDTIQDPVETRARTSSVFNTTQGVGDG